ncbi:PD-(D/E)XK nuclease family protein [Actinophytocola gossypii]|uniref:PD-(D/E)XK nuclease family protein n=1 Tax=Actinophytocola gossypii TaxID=2812003 RepID=A0ABT2J9U8_9PSEU|nr:PD-(D/E)XK nuclease family protein [Actinophytocola gossypii]MCT2584647.1 PD-(D/E)XK nuclease family protein [Actinophytocola gossypii]
MSTQQNDALPTIDLVRVGAGAARDGDATCPSSLRWKTRPMSRAVGRFPKEQLDDFVLRPVMAALDRVEFGGEVPDEAFSIIQGDGGPVHPGVNRFAEHAVQVYLTAMPSLGPVPLRPVRELWVAQRVLPSVVWELYAWGRRYESVDGGLREFRFLRLGPARERSPAEVAIAAYAAAFGTPAEFPDPWSEPFRPFGRTGAERVRVLEVGLVDGSVKPLLDCTAKEVEEYFAERGRARVVDIARGEDLVPGFGCGDCKRVAVCRGPVRMPGLLGVESGQGALRTVSVSGLRYYRKCPAQAYLRTVHLPRAYEYSAEAELGHAVHGWLETAHQGQGNACSPDTMPPVTVPVADAAWSAGKWRVTGEFANVGARMLAYHVEICPFRDAPEIDSVRVEPQLTFFDTVARAVVVAKPDLIYRERGQWVWRELKTTQKARWYYTDPLEGFPQLALAVAVLAAGGLGPGGAGRVELEILRPSGAEIVVIDPTEEERVQTARRVLREWAAPWRSDHVFEARPGRNCRGCPVSVWCPSYPGPDPDEKEDETSAASRTATEG